jgi:hypothetical protein
MQPMRLRWGALLIGVAVAGCGGGNDNHDATQRARQIRQIERVYFASAYATFEGQGSKACSHYTDDYKSEIVYEITEHGTGRVKGDTCEQVVRNLKPLLRGFAPHPNVRVANIRVSGNRASLVATIDTHFGPSRSKAFLSLVGNTWKLSHDEDLGNVQQGLQQGATTSQQ